MPRGKCRRSCLTIRGPQSENGVLTLAKATAKHDAETAIRALRAEADSKRHTAEILSTEAQRHFNEAANLTRLANSLEAGASPK
jgi:hypothetical protein